MILRRSQPVPKSDRGAAMLAALCLAMVFALCLSSYIALCYTSLKMSTRNVANSHCIELAEAGLEQALYARNNSDWNAALWTTDVLGNATATLNGFTFENGATGTVNLKVANYNSYQPPPVFTSEAFVTLPDGTVVKRQLQAQGSLMPLFPNAVGATQGIVGFKAGGTIDSYDSSLGTYSSQTPGYSAVVFSAYTPASPPPPPPPTTVNLNTAVIQGYAEGTFPYSVSYANGAEIIGPNTPSSEMIDPSRILTVSQPFQPQFAENLPSSSNPVSINLTGTQIMALGSPTATYPTPYSVLGDMTLSDYSVLSINGPVILVVNGNLSISQSAQISIASPTNGGGPKVSLEMHVVSGNMKIDGGGIVNNSLSPERLIVMSTSNTNGTLEMGTTTPFYGVMDFPNNALTISSGQQIYGALVASSITFNGSPSIHYDMHLQSASPLFAIPSPSPGPIFHAFQASSQGPGNILPITVSSVIEVAAQ